jgi:hypothetical protein
VLLRSSRNEFSKVSCAQRMRTIFPRAVIIHAHAEVGGLVGMLLVFPDRRVILASDYYRKV